MGVEISVVPPGEVDADVVAVGVADRGPALAGELTQIDELPAQVRREIGHFFSVYKDLDPDRHSEVQGWGDRDAALETIEKGRKAFIEGS